MTENIDYGDEDLTPLMDEANAFSFDNEPTDADGFRIGDMEDIDDDTEFGLYEDDDTDNFDDFE